MAHLGTLGRALSPVMPRYFVWQAWHLATSTFVSRGTRGLHLATSIFVSRGRQAWHLATSTLVLRGRREQPPPFCMAGVALRDIHLRFAWQAWGLWHWAGSGGVLGRAWARLVAGDAARFCVAGVALGDIYLGFGQAWHLVTSHLRFAWQAWHLWHQAGSGAWSPVTPLNFAWQAWHLVTSTFVSAGVALGDIHLRFAWHGVALMALGWLWWRAWARLRALGRR